MIESEVYSLAYEAAAKVQLRYPTTNQNELAKWATAIAKTESNFNPDAKNKSSTARGLMQMLICTQREVEKKHAKVDFAPASYSCKSYPQSTVDRAEDKIYDPEYAMLLAVFYLAYQYRRYKDWHKAVHAYNQGSYPGSSKDNGQKYLQICLKNVPSENSQLAAQRLEFY